MYARGNLIVYFVFPGVNIVNSCIHVAVEPEF